MKRIPYAQHELTAADEAAVLQALRGELLTQGSHVPAFEAAFAAYVGATHAVAVSSGTAALHLAVLALGLKPGQRVLTSTLTFVATANAIVYAGGVPVLVDIDPHSYLPSLQAARTLLAQAPPGSYAGLLPVNYAGYPVDMAAWRALADEHKLWLLEDACHAPGAQFATPLGWATTGSGQYADAATFSFHPAKHITTGEGGMVTTRNPELAARLAALRNHGITKNPQQLTRPDEGGWYYEQQALGYNYRLTDVQAALGSSQLTRAVVGLVRRQELAARYQARLAGVPGLVLPQVPAQVGHAYHLYVVQLPPGKRRQVYEALRQEEIFTQVHYLPVHLQPYYKALGGQPGPLPHAEVFYTRCLSLPLFSTLTDAAQDIVLEKLLQQLV